MGECQEAEIGSEDLLILRGEEVYALLAGQEKQILDTVRVAYEIHGDGDSSLPHSTFLRFPDRVHDRIIALPAYLGGDFSVAGLKWIASFPDNLKRGLERASAVIILNSVVNGTPEALIEGSVISAKRTAASAALAAQTLHDKRPLKEAGFLGCGLINFEIARFLLTVFPELCAFTVFDLDADRASQFKKKCQEQFEVKVSIEKERKGLFRNAPLISIATTANKPYIFDLKHCVRSSTILNVSLRDFAPEVILSCDNVVDDIDHVCRAQTSIHLTEQLVGNREFIRCTIADILKGRAPARNNSDNITIFSAFGLGILDIALGKIVRELARTREIGVKIRSFKPQSWIDRH